MAKLRKRQLEVRFQRQYVFDNKYIFDFYCASLKLIIEINGGQHNDNHQDDIRDNYIKNAAVKFFAFGIMIFLKILKAVFHK